MTPFLQYVFRFLYERNWHTGKRELSKGRLFWFVGVLGFFLFIVVLAWWLQSPAVYSSSA